MTVAESMCCDLLGDSLLCRLRDGGCVVSRVFT